MSSLGEVLELTAEARDAQGRVVTGIDFEWTTSDAAVASIDPKNPSNRASVTAVAEGTATITVVAAGIQATAPVTVEQRIATIAVTPGSAAVEFPGQTLDRKSVV